MHRLPSPFTVIKQAFSDWWDELVNVAGVNLVWVVCWLTIVLGPPATFGLYHVANRLTYGESVGPVGLLEAARRYFVKSWLWMLLNLAIVVVIAGALAFYARSSNPLLGLLQPVVLIFLAAWLIVQFYAIPYIMEMEPEHQTLRLALRNAGLTVLSAPGYTIFIAVVGFVIVALSVLLMVPLFVGGPWVFALLGSRALSEWLKTYHAIKRGDAPPDNAPRGGDPHGGPEDGDSESGEPAA